jgi:hypothetical protein
MSTATLKRELALLPSYAGFWVMARSGGALV